jgi:NAD(P)H-flavin reductase
MLYRHGVGEVAISVSGLAAPVGGGLVHTIRDVGAASHALHQSRPGDVLGVRGPFGTSWDIDSALGHDLVIVAGGVGLAPLRPLIQAALTDRARYGAVTVIVGARSPKEFLFPDDLAGWDARTEVELLTTIDKPTSGWQGAVGFVTEPLARTVLARPDRTIAFLCGPEPMMRFCADTLLGKGVPAEQIRVSLERNMKCGVGLCGHCQLGPLLVCRDGPVVDYATAAPLLAVREL